MKPLRVLILSDFHGRRESFSETLGIFKRSRSELMVICGDITHFGSAKQAQSLLSPITRSNIPILYVPGNCDLFSLLEAKIEGAQNIHGSCVRIDNFVFIGVGGSPSGSLNTPRGSPEDEITALLNRGLAKCPSSERLIVVSHSPPFNTKLDLAFNGEHIGSVGVRLFVEEKRPLAVFCGHVHEARGIDDIDGTVVLNPGPARHGNYAVADMNSKVEVRLGSINQD